MTIHERSDVFWWFQGESLEKLADYLSEYGASNVRLEIHKHGHELNLIVVPLGDAKDNGDPPPINESHICPPSCP